MSRSDWKESGKELGHAFKGLGKTFVRTVKTGAEKVADWAEETDEPAKDNVVVDVHEDKE